MKRIFAALCMFCIGCTPQVVYDDLDLIRENVEIQRDISVLLLEEVVKPKTSKQVQAIALQKVETEERWEYIVHAINRIIIYLEAEQYVDYAIFVANYTKAGDIEEILNKVKEQLQ